jgi:thiamine-phosphate pyrophosphorylase
VITPARIENLEVFAGTLGETLAAGDVAAVQLRLKDASDEEIGAAARRLLKVTQPKDIALILNDRPDLAARYGCDGVHIGQSDGAYADARRAVGAGRLVGVSCQDSRHLAMEAAEAGADYVAFGAFFASDTKATPHRPELEILEVWQETMLTPCVAIGGITPENCRPLVRAGADFLAVSSGLWRHPKGPAAAAAAFASQIEMGLAERDAITPVGDGETTAAQERKHRP